MNERPLDVLIVEDSDADAKLLLHELKAAGYMPTPRRVQTEDEFRREIERRPDIILSDYSLPSFSAAKALEICRQSGLAVPFIIVSGSISEEIAVDCMKRGADDYLIKDRMRRLGAAVQQAMQAHRVRTEKLQAERTRDAAMRELDHRVRNNLSVVLGLLNMTARTSETLKEFCEVFEGRTQALAAAHDALGQHQWLGADLAQLLEKVTMRKRASNHGVLRHDGERVLLPTRAVTAMAFTFHELAAWSQRRGAWSTPGGSVEVSWSLRPGRVLSLCWNDAPGAPGMDPALESPRCDWDMVSSLLTHEAQGSFGLETPVEGLRAEISLPLPEAGPVLTIEDGASAR